MMILDRAIRRAVTRPGAAVLLAAALVVAAAAKLAGDASPLVDAVGVTAGTGLLFIGAEAVLRRFGYRIGRQSSR
ncbi:MAG TPA: MMPL family transporter [Nonomuraea sp.]|nr:MMPL family transporter [Nonomuraea sp.]